MLYVEIAPRVNESDFISFRMIFILVSVTFFVFLLKVIYCKPMKHQLGASPHEESSSRNQPSLTYQGGFAAKRITLSLVSGILKLRTFI